MHQLTPASGSVQDEGLPPRKSLRPLQSLIRHPWIAIGSAGILVIAAIVVLQKVLSPVYSAESVFMVSPTTKNPGEDRETPLHRYSEFVNQQVMFVTRDDVCLDALDRMGDGRSAWQRPGESMRDAAARLSAELKVSRVPETSYVAVSLESGRSEGLVDIVNAVLKAYLEKAKGQTLFGLDSSTEALVKRVGELQDEIRGKTDQLSLVTKELGIPSVEAGVMAPMIEETERTAREAQARRVAAEARVAGVDARYKVLKDANTADRTVLVPDAELTQLRTVLLTRKSELKAKLFGLTPQHEGRKSVESEIAEIDADLVKEEKAALQRQIRTAAQRLDESHANELALSQAELAEATRRDQVVNQQLAAQRDKLMRLYPQAQGLQQEVDRLRRQHSIAQERLESMRLETQTPGYVQLAMPASLSEISTGKRLMKGIGLLVVLAGILFVGVPLGVDLIRDRVRQDSDLDGTVITIPRWTRSHDDDPEVGDQLRRVALALDRERRLRNKSAFIFTSVLPGSGTSQLVLDVSRELGEFGVYALAVEANAMTPDPRYRSNGHPGLAAGMSKGIRASELVNLSDGKFPDRIAVGPTDGRTTLSGLEKIDSFLGQVLGRYQAVLIDAPPILQSADAEFLASRGQAVVLVVEADRTPVAELDRAKRILRQVGADVVLTVMNRARRWKEQGRQTAVASTETP